MVLRRVVIMTIKQEIEYIEDIFIDKDTDKYREFLKIKLEPLKISSIQFNSSNKPYLNVDLFLKIMDNSMEFCAKNLCNEKIFSSDYNFYFFISDSCDHVDDRISRYFKIYKDLKKSLPEDVVNNISDYSNFVEETYKDETTNKIRYFSLEKIKKHEIKYFIRLLTLLNNTTFIIITKNIYEDYQNKLDILKSAYLFDERNKKMLSERLKIVNVFSDYCSKGDIILTPSVINEDCMEFSMNLYMSPQNFKFFKNLLLIDMNESSINV